MNILIGTLNYEASRLSHLQIDWQLNFIIYGVHC